MDRETLKANHAEAHPTEAEIDETLEESFPASDPPGWTLGSESGKTPPPEPAVETVIVMRQRDLIGGFKVGRVLPAAKRRMVGPFIFLDQMGPERLQANTGLDVPPHPHIGLATVTYLFEGELLHRDSLGVVQPIRPGEVNWMTAGRGIAHSERTPQTLRQNGSRLFGLQSWVALPQAFEEQAPTFAHHAEPDLPLIEGDGKRVRLIAGALYGETSPVETLSTLFYADVTLNKDALLPLPAEYEERAAYVISGSVTVRPDGETFNAGQLLVVKPGALVSLRADSPTPVHLMLLGGEPLDGPRHIWWNFVSSSPERIEQAKADWKAGRFIPVPDETGAIPLPESGPAIVRYP